MRDFEKIFLELQKDTTDPYMNKNLIQELVCCNNALLKLLDNETGNSLLHQAIIYGHYDMALFLYIKVQMLISKIARIKILLYTLLRARVYLRSC